MNQPYDGYTTLQERTYNAGPSKEISDAYDSCYEVHNTIKAMLSAVVNTAIQRGEYLTLEELEYIGESIAETMESRCNWKETDISYYPDDWAAFLKGEVERFSNVSKQGKVW